MEHRVCDTARVYTATELKGIRVNVKQERRLRILHTDTCLTIRKLRLNKRWKREKTKSKDNHRRTAKLEQLDNNTIRDHT